MTTFDDELLITIYLKGFNDELDSKTNNIYYSVMMHQRAYQLGRDHAIIGDDVMSVDYISTDEILRRIKS